jgi:hypothetical protein
MEKSMLAMHETSLKTLVGKYHTETGRLMKGFLSSPIKQDSSVSVIRLVLFHLENNPSLMYFYATRRERRKVKQAIVSYLKANEWSERKESLDIVIRLYKEVRLMMDIIKRVGGLDYTHPLSSEENELVRIGLERVRIIAKVDEIREYIDDYMLTGKRDRVPVIISLWTKYQRESLS